MGEQGFRFLDGKTSRVIVPRVSFSEQSILVYEEDVLLAQWPCTDVFVKEDWADGIGGTFSFKGNPDAGLVVYNRQIFLKIQSRLSRRDRATYLISTKVRSLLLLGGVAALSAFLLFPLVGKISVVASYFVSDAFEAKLGDITLSEMGEIYKPCSDPVAVAHLQKITDRLVAASEYPDIKPNLRLFRSRDINAFTVPGRHMVVLSGFLKNAQTENEIAAVMAHELGHMVKRDPLEAFMNAQGFNIIAAMMGSSGAYGDVTKLVSTMQNLSYSREKEYAADAYAARVLTDAGYNPDGLSSFLTRVEAEEKKGIGKYVSSFELFSTHPDTVERIRRIHSVTRPEGYRAVLGQAEFERLRQACR